MKRLAALALCLMLGPIADARDIDGAKVAETLEVGGQKVTLNGAALRTRYFAKVYVVALYLNQPATQAEHALNSSAPRLIAITMRRDTDSERIASAFLTSVARNHNHAEMAALQDRLNKFKVMMPSLKRDDVLRLEFLANGETHVLLNNQPVGALTGVDFQRALLKIWLGHTPVHEDMKKALLGEKS